MTVTETRTLVTADAASRSRRGRRSYSREKKRSILLTILLWLCVLYFILPLWWLFVSSTKDNSALFSTFGMWFGGDFSLFDNLQTLFTIRGGVFSRWLWNTLFYAVTSAVGATALAAMAGYAFAKYDFPGKKVLFSATLGAIMIPLTALALPTYLLFSQAGLTNTPWAIIIPSLVSPFGVYLMRVYAADAIPDTLIEAARVDGAGEFRIFAQVGLRLLGPGLVTVFLFSLVATWNNYFLPLIMLNSSDLYPITVGLAQIQAAASAGGGSQALFSTVITGSFVSILPLIIAFLFLQRYWQSGLATGSVKGLTMHHRSFSIGDEDFLLDGEPFRILSGAIHYFRVHPEQWADRIRKARLMGLNTIETYVAWNAHEPRRGEWDATGANDLGGFLDAVAAEGMLAIVRPGPYICAEWANGGLPVWLTGDASIGLRRSEPGYLAEVGRYLGHVYDIVAPRQIDRGGNVILVQIENEYGAYGADEDYLAALVRMTTDAGITVPLTTVDQPQPAMLRDGSLPGLHMTASFGSRAVERLRTLREFQPTGPLMSMEFWDGWFDWWGGHHHTTDPRAAAADLDELLASGASVNFYMFHGGTNFGLTNGANDKGRYRPITTSYDYDAPLDEAGNPTAKYDAFREVIARHFGVPDEQPARAVDAPEITVDLASHGDWTGGGAAAPFDAPPTFEDLDHDSALVRYEVDLPAFEGSAVLAFDEVRDRAWVRVDDVLVGTIDRAQHQSSIVVPPGGRLELLVEEQGRVNYDIRIGETKGLIGAASLGGAPLTGWRVTPIDVEQAAQSVGAADAAAGATEIGPAALRGTFALEAASDLFLDTAGFENGYIFVNGFFLGRYSTSGPQRTLYVPAPVTRAGDNDLLVLELDHTTSSSARFVPAPVLGPLEE